MEGDEGVVFAAKNVSEKEKERRTINVDQTAASEYRQMLVNAINEKLMPFYLFHACSLLSRLLSLTSPPISILFSNYLLSP